MIDTAPPVSLTMPEDWRIPLVFSSPHSGNRYPEAFLENARLNKQALCQSEDSFVDKLFARSPEFGAPLLAALFPRIFCDPNRQPFELDPQMYSDALPAYAVTRSLRLSNGLGTIARYAADGRPVYKRKLTFKDIRHRIDDYYQPFHSQLQELLMQGVKKFGFVILMDCHSMPSRNKKGAKVQEFERPDFVLGDRFGHSCHRDIMTLATSVLKDLGYRVEQNIPYAGGYITEHYGSPEKNVHALQIEINRALYMDEDSRTLKPAHAKLIEDLGVFVNAIGKIALPRTLEKAR